jgi:hypothetical protein
MRHMDDQWTARERTMLASLTRHRVGSAALEDRVVHALVERGLLRRVAMAFGRSSLRVLGQLTAAAMVFVVGVVVGRTGHAADVPVASRDHHAVEGLAGGQAATMVPDLALEQAAPIPRASLGPILQRVGTAYVGVLVMLPVDTVDALTRIARDVARMTFNAAALQLARTHRDTIIAMRRAAVLDAFAKASP